MKPFNTCTIDDAADTLRSIPNFAFEVQPDPDATSIYDIHDIDTAPVRHIGQGPRMARRRMIHATRQEIAGLRDAIAEGWDVSLELAYEERRLAALEAGS